MNLPLLAASALLFFGGIEGKRRSADLPPKYRRRLIWGLTVFQIIGALIFLMACVSG